METVKGNGPVPVRPDAVEVDVPSIVEGAPPKKVKAPVSWITLGIGHAAVEMPNGKSCGLLVVWDGRGAGIVPYGRESNSVSGALILLARDVNRMVSMMMKMDREIQQLKARR